MDTKTLKDKILQLAVQGKLVSQNPNDEPASVLLEKIREEKERLIKEGELKKQKPLPEIREDEIPYELPEGWEWVRLGNLGQINPRNVVHDNLEVSFVPMALIPQDYSSCHGQEIRKWGEVKKGYTHLADNDVVVAKITPCFQNGKSVIMRNLCNGIGAGTTELHVFRGNSDHLMPEYTFIFFKSPDFLRGGEAMITGTAGQQRVPLDYVIYNPFPLPPFDVQRRIVKKVERLMTLIDELDNDRSELLDAISVTRDKILQLAVQGKLVSQNPNDEPASVLLEKIREEKERLIKEGELKKQKPLPEIREDEIPYELPEGWEWVRLGEVASLKSGTSLKSAMRKEELGPDGIPYIKVSDMNLVENSFQIKRATQVIQPGDDTNRYLIPKDSIIFPKRGGAIRTNKKRIVKSEILVDSNIMALVLPSVLELTYVYYWFTSVDLWALNSGTSVPQINNKDIAPIIMPLPPYDEQKRIVKKVDQLMSLCDELEKNIKQSEKDNELLMQSVLHKTAKETV